MPGSPGKLVTIDDPCKKVSVELSESSNEIESDQKQESATNTNNLDGRTDLISETSGIDNETATRIQSKNGVESHVEVSGISKNEYLQDFTPEIDVQKTLVLTPISAGKRLLTTEDDSDIPPSLPRDSFLEVKDKECSSVVIHSEESFVQLDSKLTKSLLTPSEVLGKECSNVQEQQSGMVSEMSLSFQLSNFSSRIPNKEITDNRIVALEEESPALPSTPSVNSVKNSVSSLTSNPPLTQFQHEISPSPASISSDTFNQENTVPFATSSESPSSPTTTLEKPSTKLDLDLRSLSFSSPNSTHQESSISSAILSQQQSKGLEEAIPPCLLSGLSDTTNQEHSVPLEISPEQATRHEERQPVLPATISEDVNKEFSIPLTLPLEPSTRLNDETPHFLPLTASSEQVTRHDEVQAPLPPTSSLAENKETSISLTVSSEQLCRLKETETGTSRLSSEIKNKECSSLFPKAQPSSNTSPFSTTTSSKAAAKEISSSEKQTEALAKKLLEQVATIKTLLKEVKEIESLLDAGYLRCHCNGKRISTTEKSPGCKQCPGSLTMHLYAQEVKYTTSQLFVQLQRIYSWFRSFENIDHRFKVHIADVENLHDAISLVLTRFNLGHW